jgi:Cu+-exporting ATPase
MSNQIEIKVKGMTCSGCANTVTKYLENQGLKNVYVNFTTDEVRFTNEALLSIDKLAKGINSLGYQAILPDTQKSSFINFNNIQFKFWVTLPFTLILMLHMFVNWHPLHMAWVQFILCLPVAAIGFWHFGRSAFQSIKQKLPNMDVLIFIGASSAFIYSLIGWLVYNANMQYIYFETTASIITLVLLGNMIEKNAASRTASVISDLEKLKPSKATKVIKDLLSANEIYTEVSVKDLNVGDLVLINSGTVVPVDGLVMQGQATINEAMISGESIPAAKNIGSKVIAGTMILDGNIYVKTTALEKNTRLSGLIEMIKNAQLEKPSIQRFGDRVAAIFVPVVVTISILTFIINYIFIDKIVSESMMRAIAVLVISCPCAMGLATPLAVMVGIGSAARKGILIKSGAQIETLSQANYYIFDKTGTLTTGNLKVSDFNVYDFSERDAKNYIHFIERHSNHPIAKSILEQCEDWNHHNIAFNKIEEIRGLGMQANDMFGNKYTLGNLKLVEIPIKTNIQADIYFTYNGKIAATFNINDEVINAAAQTIKAIQNFQAKTMILSGDSLRKCEDVAKQLGITEIKAHQTPEQKLRLVKKLSKEYKTAMIGDGINDAPALALAHVGISHGLATDIAKNTSGIVLTGNAIDQLRTAVGLSKVTYQTIKQNLLWAMLYNAVAIPLAAAGYLSPILAALGMAFSDLVVIGNSLLLKWKISRSYKYYI